MDSVRGAAHVLTAKGRRGSSATASSRSRLPLLKGQHAVAAARSRMRGFSSLSLRSFCSLAASLLLAGCAGEQPSAEAHDLMRVDPFEYGKTVFFGSGGDGERAKLTGWALTEPSFTWTDGIAASLAMRLPATQDVVQLEFRMCGMNVPKRRPFQRVDLYVNAERLARWQVADEDTFTVTLPEKFLSKPDPLLIIDFYMPNASSPVSLGLGVDLRRLGIRLSEVKISASPRQTAITSPESHARARVNVTGSLPAAVAPDLSEKPFDVLSTGAVSIAAPRGVAEPRR